MERLGRGKSDLARFFDVADRIYRDDPLWVPPLRADVAKVLSAENPFFRHAEMQLFLARRGEESVGRIAAIVDRAHNARHRDHVAFFGFFECEDDLSVAGALFEAAGVWARERKMRVLRGPANPSLNDEAGLLIAGFDSPPVFMMTYNPPYYAALFEACGLRKAKDLLAYWFDVGPRPLERLERLTERLRRQHPEIRVRPVTKKSLAADLALIQEVYNEAWEDNWGFVPMTADEMAFMAKRLKPLLDPEFIFLAEAPRQGGGIEPVAFLMSLPDYNRAMAPMRGRILPFGWLKFLAARRRIRTLRIVTLGIKKDYRLRGVHSVMFEAGLRAALSRGFTGCEVSWLLEDNELVIRSLRLFEGRLYKTYRLYDRNL